MAQGEIALNFIDLMTTFDILTPKELSDRSKVPLDVCSGLFFSTDFYTKNDLLKSETIKQISTAIGCHSSSLIEAYRESRYGGYVYLMETNDIQKIGRSNNPDERHKTLRLDYPALQLVHSIFTNQASTFERQLHERYKAYRLLGEWFRLPENEINVLCSIKRYHYKPWE